MRAREQSDWGCKWTECTADRGDNDASAAWEQVSHWLLRLPTTLLDWFAACQHSRYEINMRATIKISAQTCEVAANSGAVGGQQQQQQQ